MSLEKVEGQRQVLRLIDDYFILIYLKVRDKALSAMLCMPLAILNQFRTKTLVNIYRYRGLAPEYILQHAK